MAGFMQLQVWAERAVVTVHGETVPFSVDPSGEMVDGGAKWWAWYNAPGYMDCTSIVGPFNDACAAGVECFKMFGEEGYEGEKTADETELEEVMRHFNPDWSFERDF